MYKLLPAPVCYIPMASYMVIRMVPPFHWIEYWRRSRSRIASSRSQLALQWRPKMFIWSGFCASYPKVEEPTQKHRHILLCLAQLSLGTNHWSRRSNQCHPGLPRELSSDIRGIGCPPIFTSSLPKSLELSKSSVLKPEYLPSGPNVGNIGSLWPQTPGHGGE